MKPIDPQTHFFSSGVFFNPIFKRVREAKQKWKIKKKLKDTLEKSIKNKL